MRLIGSEKQLRVRGGEEVGDSQEIRDGEEGDSQEMREEMVDDQQLREGEPDELEDLLAGLEGLLFCFLKF